MMIITQSDDLVVPTIKGRPFRLLLAGSAASVLGTRVSTIAFPMLVLWLTGSPVDAGWMAFAATAPSVIAYVPAGALVDRWRPWRVMLISEAGRGIAIATVAAAILLHWASLPLLMIAAIVEETLEVFSTLAERRYVGLLVGDEEASPALVRMEARTHVMVLAGRPLGGFLFALMPMLPFIADTVSFAISITALIKIRSRQAVEFACRLRAKVCPSPQAVKTAHEHRIQTVISHSRQFSWGRMWSDIRAGARWIRFDHFTRITVLLSAGTTLACQALIMVFLAYAHSHRLSSLAIGIALATSGLGGVFGSILASRLPAPNKPSWTLIRICTWSISVIILALSGGKSFVSLTFVMGSLGFTGALGNVELGTYLIHNVPAGMLACVTSVGRLSSFSACAIGPVFGGFLIQVYKLHDSVMLLCITISSLMIVSLFLPSVITQAGHICAKSATAAGDLARKAYRLVSAAPACLRIGTSLAVTATVKSRRLLATVLPFMRIPDHENVAGYGVAPGPAPDPGGRDARAYAISSLREQQCVPAKPHRADTTQQLSSGYVSGRP